MLFTPSFILFRQELTILLAKTSLAVRHAHGEILHCGFALKTAKNLRPSNANFSATVRASEKRKIFLKSLGPGGHFGYNFIALR